MLSEHVLLPFSAVSCANSSLTATIENQSQPIIRYLLRYDISQPPCEEREDMHPTATRAANRQKAASLRGVLQVDSVELPAAQRARRHPKAEDAPVERYLSSLRVADISQSVTEVEKRSTRAM